MIWEEMETPQVVFVLGAIAVAIGIALRAGIVLYKKARGK